MKAAARVRLSVVIGVAASVAVLGLAGCGRTGTDGDGAAPALDTGAASDVTELGWEGQALEAIGFNPADLAPAAAPAAAPAPSASAGPGADRNRDRLRRHHKRLRFGFGGRVLHGEAVVQTDEGTKTVVVQRGTVTAIDADSVSVRSADGFTLTWTFGDPIRVVERRTEVQPRDIAVGTEVGIAGAMDGDKTVARLIVVPARPNK
jgi:hypothetical protein